MGACRCANITHRGQNPTPVRHPEEVQAGRRAVCVRVVATEHPAGVDSRVIPSARHELPGACSTHLCIPSLIHYQQLHKFIINNFNISNKL
jgi:hypothetical protein